MSLNRMMTNGWISLIKIFYKIGRTEFNKKMNKNSYIYEKVTSVHGLAKETKKEINQNKPE